MQYKHTRCAKPPPDWWSPPGLTKTGKTQTWRPPNPLSRPGDPYQLQLNRLSSNVRSFIHLTRSLDFIRSDFPPTPLSAHRLVVSGYRHVAGSSCDSDTVLDWCPPLKCRGCYCWVPAPRENARGPPQEPVGVLATTAAYVTTPLDGCGKRERERERERTVPMGEGEDGR